MDEIFKDMDNQFTKFLVGADEFVKKLKTIHIPVKVVESEYVLGTTDGTSYTVRPRR